MSNKQVKIHGGPNNTAATVTGQEELLVKQSMIGSSTVVINDTNALAGEFESIVVLEATVFSNISVAGANVLSSLVTTPATAVKAGAIISWGKGQFITNIQLTSGSVLAVRR
jgi:hypothetical protein